MKQKSVARLAALFCWQELKNAKESANLRLTFMGRELTRQGDWLFKVVK